MNSCSQTVEAGPEVDRSGVTFRYEAGELAVGAVHLVQEVVHGAEDPQFDLVGEGVWALRFDRPPVDRFEYRFFLAYADGRSELVLDPANARRAEGAFGERSVVEFPGYQAPAWVDAAPPRGEGRALMLESQLLGEGQPAYLWSAHGSAPGAELPLLVALDGLELDRFGGLIQMLDTLSWWGELPPMRALLLHPTHRSDHYSASPDFAAALANELLPFIEREAPASWRIGLGASLGGLALLHAHSLGEVSFTGLLLESGSFLGRGRVPGFEHSQRIEDFVVAVHAGRAGAPLPVEMTCGVVEEIYEDNVVTAAALVDQGFRARLDGRPDAHNWIAWRDAWTPHLVDLVRTCST
jgi:enterochelin esterase-like enzyme